MFINYFLKSSLSHSSSSDGNHIGQKPKSFGFAWLVLMLLFAATGIQAQTTIINPATDGGFNLGNSFAANGWTVANEGVSPVKWAVGSAASGFTSVGTTTNASATVTLTAANALIAPGQIVYGSGIAANTFVLSISGTTLTLSQNATAGASGVTLGFGMFTGGISVGTTQTTNTSIAVNTYSVTLSAANPNISVGMAIAPIPGFIDAGTYVASISGTTLGLSKASLNGSILAVAQTMVFSATSSAITGNAAYVSNDNGFTNSYGGYPTNRTVYFYKDITTIPSTEKAMTLTFDVKSVPASGAGWQVWVAPISQTVVGTDTQVTAPFTYGVNWPGATLISFNATPQVATTKTTAFIPKSFAGTSFRLIFVWTNGTSAGTLPPAAIDNISLVSRVPEEITCAQSGLWSQTATWDGGKVPTPADVVVLDGTETVVVDSRYSGAEDLILAGTNSLVQFAISGTIIDEFTIANDLNISGSGSRFNGHDGGTNGKAIKVGHDVFVGASACRLDISTNSNTVNNGALILNGSALQTVTVETGGFCGGSAAGTNAFGNRSRVLNQLFVTNTATATPNVVMDLNGSVIINGRLELTSGRVNIASGRLVIGDFGATQNIFVSPGSGFTGGTISKFISSANTSLIQSGSDYPGKDINSKPYWYPFISGAKMNRSIYLLPDTNPSVAGEVAVTYTDSNVVTNSLAIADGAYTINNRYGGSWAFSTPDASVTGTPLFYTNNAPGTNRVAAYANGAYEALNGSSRLMNFGAALPGAHQEGTDQPFVLRTGLTLSEITSAPLYVGVSDASKVDNTAAITSTGSGSWASTGTWVGGVVPTCSNNVVIASGHTVTVTANADAAGVVINAGGTLVNNGGTMTVGCTNNNAAFYNYGTHTMTSGNLVVNGAVAHKANSFFNQTGGEIKIDSNDNGNIATSVGFGGTSCKIETGNLDLTGGTITIVDPLADAGTSFSASSIGDYTATTAGATGTFTVNGTIAAGTLSTVNITGTYNLFEIGQEVSGHANIPAGTTISGVTVGFAGFPPPVTLTLSQPATGAIAAGTPLNYSSMKNGGSTVVLQANPVNLNLQVGQAVSGSGIQAGAKITNIVVNGSFADSSLCKITLSLPVSGLATSPITTPETLSFGTVNAGSNGTILAAANAGIVQGAPVSGTGIKPGTFVASINSTSIVLSEPIQPGAPSPLVMNFHPETAVSSGAFIYNGPKHYAAGLNHTLQIGDGVSTQNAAIITNGFNCVFQNTVGSGFLFSLGNLTVNAPDGDNRFMSTTNFGTNSTWGTLNVQNQLTINSGSTLKKVNGNCTYYVGGNIVNNGSFLSPSASSTLYLGNFINGVAVPTTLQQTLSGTGLWSNNQWHLNANSPSGSFSNLTVNNTNTQGVTLNVANFRTILGTTLTNGILHTSATYPIYCGVADVTGPFFGGSFTGGNATSYIEGPAVYANKSDATVTQYRLFPVGKNGKFLPISIASSGGVELMVEAFDTNSGTVNGAIGSNVSATRWAVSRVGTAGAFTGYNVRMGALPNINVNASNVIVQSATANGTYDVFATPATAITFTAGTPNTINLTTAQTGGMLSNFAYSDGVACTGTPAPGATITSSAVACSGQPITLSLTTPTTGAGVTYQWQSSTNGGTTWANVSGATAATYVATPAVNTSYQCNVTCSSSTGTSTPVAVAVTESVAVGTGDTICVSGMANLSSSGSSILNWYDAPTGGNLVATGTAYGPNVNTTTTYYVSSASASSGSVNTAAWTGTGASTALFKGIAFDATNKLKLKTVTVYPKNTAARTSIIIALYDATGNVVAGTTPVIFVPTLNTGTLGATSQVVTLNYNIPAGTGYRLVATYGLAATTNTLGNSTGVITYPTAGSLRLTGNVSALNDAIVATANTTNCFHNLTYDEICESTTRTPVIATVGCTKNLKLFIEGYYIGGGAMTAVKANEGVGTSTTDVDDVTVELRDASTYAVVSSTTAVLKTDGTVAAQLVAPAGNYFIAVKHRNAIQTWSAAAEAFGTSTSTYDFSTAANKAYGSNMKNLGSGVFGFYSGDINQDESIDVGDFPALFSDNDNFISGYFNTDLNGDGTVDVGDFPILFLNSDNFIFSNHP